MTESEFNQHEHSALIADIREKLLNLFSESALTADNRAQLAVVLQQFERETQQGPTKDGEE